MEPKDVAKSRKVWKSWMDNSKCKPEIKQDNPSGFLYEERLLRMPITVDEIKIHVRNNNLKLEEISKDMKKFNITTRWCFMLYGFCGGFAFALLWGLVA